MRGEYKVRGGKLVAADVEETNGEISSVFISGDFFLEPDSALETLNSCLLGMPTSSSVVELARCIDNALGADVSMIGFTSEAVGIAVRRALGKATSWHDHTFDLIPAVAMAPAMHVALDEVLSRKVAAGERRPLLRFWDWNEPLVVIGSYQSFKNEIDPEGQAKHSINVVRRISGGGAMFMEPGNCITYSLVVPGSLVEGLSFEQSYAFLDDWVLGALGTVGVQAHYVPLNDIASDKGKIGGAAQRRFNDGTVMHHVTMAYDIDASKMLEVLRIGREKLSDKGTKSANKRVDPMRSQTGMARDEIINAFLAYFRSQYDCVDSMYTEDELAEAAELVRTKFDTDEWRYRIP